MNYSNHALRRMNARNITVAMVETSFDDCLKFGNWDQKGDRLTIDATSDDFHEHIQSTQKNLLNLKQQLAALKENIPKTLSNFSRRVRLVNDLPY